MSLQLNLPKWAGRWGLRVVTVAGIVVAIAITYHMPGFPREEAPPMWVVIVAAALLFALRASIVAAARTLRRVRSPRAVPGLPGTEERQA